MTTITADSVIAEVGSWLREAARPSSGNITRDIERAANSFDISFRRAKAVWYGEAVSILAHEYLTMQARRRALISRQIQWLSEQEQRAHDALARIDRELAALDQEEAAQR